MSITIAGDSQWVVRRVPKTASARRSRAAPGADALEALLQPGRLEIAEVLEVAPRVTRARRAPAPTALELSVEAAAGEAYVIATRHPSGALTFHRAVTEAQVTRRGRRSVASTFRFVVPVRADAPAPDTGPRRRSLLGKVFKVVVLKIVDKVTSVAIPLLVKALEARLWKSAGRAEGWLHVTQAALAAGKLPPVDWRKVPRDDQPCLLLIHGTFSNAASAYKGLADSDFFARIAPHYGDRVFAYDHFSLSKTPEENARDLLAAMPDGLGPFDVVTHSRGGLVLRNLVERRTALGPAAKRFRLGHAVLVACPNAGTPIATPARWQDTVGWFANLLELFPDNPFTTAAGFVSEAIVWLARHLSADIRGLHAMDMRGGPITELQRPPGPPARAYSALAANFEPDANLALRLADLGLDAFFASANDLVVPTEGGWRIDTGSPPAVDAKRIGCFGPGGNVASSTGTDVHHVNFFSQPETVEFLVRALERRDQGLPPLSPEFPFAGRRSRGLQGDRHAEEVDVLPREGLVTTGPQDVRYQDLYWSQSPKSDKFEIVILPDNYDGANQHFVFAGYRGARVLDRFESRNPSRIPRATREPDESTVTDDAGGRWHAIINAHETIKRFIDGEPGVEMPSELELMKLGQDLFDALFTPRIRALYDSARSGNARGFLDVVFTSMIPWVADKPWEFAYDKIRGTFLATEDVHFTRNVITAIPSDLIQSDSGILRILVVVAQPLRFAALSAEQEERVIRRGFQKLIDSKLVSLEVLVSATPSKLHDRMLTGVFDIVHFIGHGEFDERNNEGYLVFETERGDSTRVNARSMREILGKRGVKLIFLNACETGVGGSADFNRGIAPALMRFGVPAVVANQYKVLDVSATAFAKMFYWGLAQGMTLGESAREARISLNYANEGESIDWAIPVLYAFEPNMRLTKEVPKHQRSSFGPQEVDRGAGAGVQSADVRRIAVWDVANAYPDLDRTLERMSAAQERFRFELVDVSLPMGTWSVGDVGKSGSRRTFLHGKQVTRALRRVPNDLGVDYLACVTRHPIVGAIAEGVDATDIYGWWSGSRAEPVCLLSTAFLNLPPTGKRLSRAIANGTVWALIELLRAQSATEELEDIGPRYANDKAQLAALERKQRLSKDTRAWLLDVAPRELRAFEALLSVFWGV